MVPLVTGGTGVLLLVMGGTGVVFLVMGVFLVTWYDRDF